MNRVLLPLILISLAAPAAFGQEDGGQAAVPAQSSASRSQSGFDKISDFGGPDGVSGQLRQADDAGDPLFQWDAPETWLGPWYDWKKEINEDYGVGLGFFFSVLGQKASDSTIGDDDALGGIYRFNGTWTLLNRGEKNQGRLAWRLESRSNIGRQAPQTLGSATGVAALNTGFAYSERFKVDLSVFNWEQAFLDDRAGFAVGRLAFDVYLDSFAFQTFGGAFINRGFVLNPTIATTGIGALGAVGRWYFTDQMWVTGQVYDGNAASGEWDWDTVQENEYLTAIDVGWTPSFDRRKLSKVQLTYWRKDARTDAGIGSGSGWAVSSSWQVGDNWLPFIRFGSSDGGAGAAAEDSISAGFQYTLRPDQKLALGVGWARPSEKTNGERLDDEYVIEGSYNVQLAKNLALLPDLQVIIDPASNPDKDYVVVGGVRAILTF